LLGKKLPDIACVHHAIDAALKRWFTAEGCAKNEKKSILSACERFGITLKAIENETT
jgi:hypothetical protein